RPYPRAFRFGGCRRISSRRVPRTSPVPLAFCHRQCCGGTQPDRNLQRSSPPRGRSTAQRSRTRRLRIILARDLKRRPVTTGVLARALISNPELLLLDEPFGALDALTRITAQQLLLNTATSRNFGVLLVTHDVAEAVALADRVI